MKKMMTSLVLGAAVAGLFGAGSVVKADVTRDSKTEVSATFDGGDLTLTQVTGTAALQKDGKNPTTADVYFNGATLTGGDLAATVTDLRGDVANDKWSLQVKAAGWQNGKGEQASVLNAATFTLGTGDLVQGFDFAHGGEGDNVLAGQALALTIPKDVMLDSTTYTNTLNWTLIAQGGTDDMGDLSAPEGD